MSSALADTAASTTASTTATAAASAAAPAAAQVAQALSWLDPLMGALWLAVIGLGLWRFRQLMARHREQAQLRNALGVGAPMSGAGGARLGGAWVGGAPAVGARGFAIAAAVCALALGLCAASVLGGPGAAQWQALDEGARQWSAAHMPPTLSTSPTSDGPGASGLGIALLQGLTDSGDVLFMALVTVVFAVWLARRKRWLDLQVWLFFAVVNGLSIRVLKQLADRERPDNLHQLVVSGASFPSGHAAGSLLVYGLLALLLAAHWPAAKRQLLLALAVLWALAIGVSRVLLAAHWASDVAAGWLLGATSVLLAVAVSRALRAD